MKKTLVLAFCLFLSDSSFAQNVGPPGSSSGTPPPCTAFGATAGTCAQGNDSRIAGAVQSGGALGTPSSGNLANTTGYPAAALPAATISTQGAVVSGCAAWTPTDQSGAGITFSAVSGLYCITGPAGGQFVTIFFTVTYPVSVSGSTAAISTPVPVPNQSYAQVSALSNCTLNTCGNIRTVINTSTMNFFALAGVSAATNTTLSTLTVHAGLTYPVQ